jgi:iron complex outermembrane receptor protein
MSGKLADDLYFMVGGYATTSPGVRDTQFDSEVGQQFTVNITKRMERGKVNLYARYTDDHGAWYLPFAVNVPGVDKGEYTQLGERQPLPHPAGQRRRRDPRLRPGRRPGLQGLCRRRQLRARVRRRLDGARPLQPDRRRRQHLRPGAGRGGDHGRRAEHRDRRARSPRAAGRPWAPTTTSRTGAPGSSRRRSGHDQRPVDRQDDRYAHQLSAGYYASSFKSDDFWTIGNVEPMQVKANGDYLAAPSPAPTWPRPAAPPAASSSA